MKLRSSTKSPTHDWWPNGSSCLNDQTSGNLLAHNSPDAGPAEPGYFQALIHNTNVTQARELSTGVDRRKALGRPTSCQYHSAHRPPLDHSGVHASNLTDRIVCHPSGIIDGACPTAHVRLNASVGVEQQPMHVDQMHDDHAFVCRQCPVSASKAQAAEATASRQSLSFGTGLNAHGVLCRPEMGP